MLHLASPAKAKKAGSTDAKVPRSTGGSKMEETVEKIQKYLWESHDSGIDSVPEEEVVKQVGYTHTDSHGYREAVKYLVREAKHATKSNKALSLTEAGSTFGLKKFGSTKPTSNKEAAERLKARMMTMSDNKVPSAPLDKVWKVLADGNGHTSEELLEVAGYQRMDSAGFKHIYKWFKKMSLTERKNGLVYFTDKVFPFGRP